MDPCRSNIGGVLTPATPAALTPMVITAAYKAVNAYNKFFAVLKL